MGLVSYFPSVEQHLSPSFSRSFTHRLISGVGGWGSLSVVMWHAAVHACVQRGADICVLTVCLLLHEVAACRYFLCVCTVCRAALCFLLGACFTIRVWSYTGITVGLSEPLMKYQLTLAICSETPSRCQKESQGGHKCAYSMEEQENWPIADQMCNVFCLLSLTVSNTVYAWVYFHASFFI